LFGPFVRVANENFSGLTVVQSVLTRLLISQAIKRVDLEEVLVVAVVTTPKVVCLERLNINHLKEVMVSTDERRFFKVSFV
jgi:hypothetical protein